jgi:uncharacterized lipoprotein NlpE involved in copper resistance
MATLSLAKPICSWHDAGLRQPIPQHVNDHIFGLRKTSSLRGHPNRCPDERKRPVNNARTYRYMGGFVKLSVILLAVATVVSAATQQSDGAAPPAQPADMHNSRISLDWAGTYEGVLPCPDCPGTKTTLTINSDGSYRLVTRAQGSQNAEKSVSGVFTWQPSGNAITLDERGGRQQFSMGEGRLTLLRAEGGASQSPAANLVLTLAAPAPHSGDLEQQLGRYRWLVFATDANNRQIADLPPGHDHISSCSASLARS